MPSHILPTVSIEQQAEIELKQAIEQQRRHLAVEQAANHDQESTDADDEEIYRQRAWDDWKDEHPRGYGNSKLRPCAQ